MKTSPWRKVAAACIVAAGFCFVIAVYSAGLTDKNASQRDFIEYWAAGRLLVHGANPYDLEALLQLERTAGLEGNQPRVTPSPPLVLLLALPLGFVGAKTGLIFWLVIQLCCVLASIGLLWRLQGSPPSGLHWLGMVYAPALACLLSGQISIFMLLGVTLFLYWRRSRPLLAGAALLPCALKPHLFLAFAIVLLLWVVSRKAYRIAAGFGGALAASSALVLCLDRRVWFQYAQLSHANNILNVFIPTLSDCFRLLIDRKAAWPIFLPAAVSCVWAIWYFRTRRDRWDWMDQGLLVLLVSVACAPYAFFYDEAVLLPAFLVGIYRAVDNRRSLVPLGLISMAALVETGAEVPITSPFYLWTPLAWLGWYLYANRRREARAEEAHRD